MSRDRYIKRVSVATIALCSTLALAGQAHALAEAASRVAPSIGAPAMPLGEVALPPLGFLDLCERSPGDCVEGRAARPDIAALRAEVHRRFWADAFARRASGPAALSSSPRADAPASFDWSRVFGAARRAEDAAGRLSAAREQIAGSVAVVPGLITTTVGTDTTAGRTQSRRISPSDWGGIRTRTLTVSAPAASDASAAPPDMAVAAGDVAMAAPEQYADAMIEGETPAAGDIRSETVDAPVAEIVISSAKTFALDKDGWALVNQINRRANRTIRQLADVRQYGVEDFWARPTGGRARGDCEDYVLAKRRDLIDAGVPAEALSIAIVETQWGESHAVLLLASDQGEYVLDNLTPWVSRWDRVNYTWRERQLPGRPFDWVRAAV